MQTSGTGVTQTDGENTNRSRQSIEYIHFLLHHQLSLLHSVIKFSQLNLLNSLDLYKCAKAFADIVIPQVSRSVENL